MTASPNGEIDLTLVDAQPVPQRAVVCGAGGFIGGHLVERLANEGFWVRGVDVKKPEFRESAADEFVLADLRDPGECSRVLEGATYDHVYQLAADMGGMEFIESAETEVLRNNVLINVNMIHAAAANKIPQYFYSSSVCVYRDMAAGEPELTEDDAYPAQPDNEYGWEKLYSGAWSAPTPRGSVCTLGLHVFRTAMARSARGTAGERKLLLRSPAKPRKLRTATR